MIPENCSNSSSSKMDEALQRIRRLFTCAACASPFKNPVGSKCGHIFCGPCFKALTTRRTSSCPACEMPLSLEHSTKREDFAPLLKSFTDLAASCEDIQSEHFRRSSSSKDCLDALARETQEETVESVSEVKKAMPQANGSAGKNVSPRPGRIPKRKRPVGDQEVVPAPVLEPRPIAEVPNPSSSRKRDRLSVATANSGDSDVPLDLSLNLSNSQKSKNLMKRSRIGFAVIHPSLALDLSVKTARVPAIDLGRRSMVPVKRPIRGETSKRHLYSIDTFENPSFTTKSHVEWPNCPSPSPLNVSKLQASSRVQVLSKESEGSENSDNVLCKAMDAILSAEEKKAAAEDPSVMATDNGMLSDDDADLLNVLMDDAEETKDANKCQMEETDHPSPGNKKIKMNDATEVELLSSSPAKIQEPPSVVTNGYGKDGGEESDSGSSDVLFQTPKSEARTPRRKGGSAIKLRSASKSKNSTPKPSPLRNVPVFNIPVNETPNNVPILCVSPPSGAVIAHALNQSSENYDPFASAFDDVPMDIQVCNEIYEDENPPPTKIGSAGTGENLSSKYPVTPQKWNTSNNRGSAQKLQERLGFETPKSRCSKQLIPSSFPVRTPPSQKKRFGVSAAELLSPSKARKFVFCPTRLSSIQLTKLRQLCGMCGGKISREYSEEVTHLILTLENDRVPQTMKYLFAIAGKKWVVTFDWVEDCLRQKKIVREEPYETSNFPDCDPGVRKSRLAEVPLFKGYQFYVLGNLDSSGATINDWMNLLKKLGARVITSEDQVRKNVIIVGDSLDRTEDYQGWYDSHGTITVAWEWILDCVLSYSKLHLAKTHYLITKLTAEQFSDLELPKELLP